MGEGNTMQKCTPYCPIRFLAPLTPLKICENSTQIIPSLHNWEEILYITEPDSWTAAAMYQASRLFISNLNARASQRCAACIN